MPNLLPRTLYERDPRTVARELLGKVLIRRAEKHLIAGRIVETEAYLGERDLAAHAAAGMTPRNAVLFGPAGHAYVYFTYGMYHCMNISCEKAGRAGCVLLRALEPLSGLEEMALGRRIALPYEPTEKTLKLLTSGPGRLCQALHITRADDNGIDVTSRRSDLQVVEDDYHAKRIIATERIGITKDAHLKLRYVIAGSPFVSGKTPISKLPPAPPAPTPARTLPAPRARRVRTPRAADAAE
jgi:DNA-3-methyladenine glycosylase